MACLKVTPNSAFSSPAREDAQWLMVGGFAFGSKDLNSCPGWGHPCMWRLSLAIQMAVKTELSQRNDTIIDFFVSANKNKVALASFNTVTEEFWV